MSKVNMKNVLKASGIAFSASVGAIFITTKLMDIDLDMHYVICANGKYTIVRESDGNTVDVIEPLNGNNNSNKEYIITTSSGEKMYIHPDSDVSVRVYDGSSEHVEEESILITEKHARVLK